MTYRPVPESYAWYIHKNIKKINRAGQPVVVYIHPHDIDPRQPLMKLKFFNRLMYYYGLKGAKEKFTRLVKAFDWGDSGRLPWTMKSNCRSPRFIPDFLLKDLIIDNCQD